MPRASIDYMNARRALKPASGGKTQSRAVKYAPDDHDDGYEIARNVIGAFSLWAETTRQVQAQRLSIPQNEPETDIPF
jgi:hypothetical protein